MPAAARLGDLGVPHCSPYIIATGAASVSINGRPAARVGDISSPHLKPGAPCGTHVAKIILGSTSVMIEGKPAAFVGSYLAKCTFVATGSEDVTVGF